MSTAHPTRSDETHDTSAEPSLRVKLLGLLRIHRGNVALELPPSRKVRALIGYLALAPEAQQRSHLCDLFWDVAHDPRRELRWCLNKIRNLFDDPVRPRVKSRGDAITLDLTDCFVDAVHVAGAMRPGIEAFDLEQLRALAHQYAGDVLAGLEIPRSPRFNGWLSGQRRRFRLYHALILEQLARQLPLQSEELIGVIERWLELEPFELQAHERLLTALAQHGRTNDAEAHLAATVTIFKAEGLDWAPLVARWRAICCHRVTVPRTEPPLVPHPPLPGDHFASAEPTPSRTSLAVMPFGDDLPAGSGLDEIADSLTYDVITRLAKLRCVFVIARGTVFALAAQAVSAEQVGRCLKVDYVCSGWIRRQGAKLFVTIELAHARTARIAWAEVFEFKPDGDFAAIGEIGTTIVASVAREVERLECKFGAFSVSGSLKASGAD